MQPIVKTFISELHTTRLKALAFRKKHHTFFRVKPEYTEYFQLQGSAWNDPDEPWTFYINVSVDFPDLPKLKSSYHHASDRIESIIRRAAPQYELRRETYYALLDDIPSLFEEASLCLSALIPPIHQYVKEKALPSVIPIPLSWLTEP